MAKCISCKNQLHWSELDGKRLLMCRVCGSYYNIVDNKLVKYDDKVEKKASLKRKK